jgi:hypothetical protein
MTPSEPGEAVHLGEDLVERLLALVVAAHAAARAAAGAADGVELVDEDDRRGGLLGLVEQVAHAGRADADDHLDELRGAEAEERHVGLAGHGAGQQRLAGARRAAEQDALGDHRAEAPVLVRVLEEVDDLDELLLGLVDARDVLERRALLVGLVALGLRAAQAGQAARAPPAGAAHDEDEDADDQQRRAEEQQEVDERRAARVDLLGVDLDLLALEVGRQLLGVDERRAASSGTRLLGLTSFLAPGGLSLRSNSPWTMSPWALTLTTWPAST